MMDEKPIMDQVHEYENLVANLLKGMKMWDSLGKCVVGEISSLVKWVLQPYKIQEKWPNFSEVDQPYTP